MGTVTVPQLEWFLIHEHELRVLKKLATRLYSEERMNGDDMRNMAQAIDHVVKLSRDIPFPENKQ